MDLFESFCKVLKDYFNTGVFDIRSRFLTSPEKKSEDLETPTPKLGD